MQYERFAEIYDFLMKDVPYEQWTEFILKKTGKERGDTALDAACGTGSVTLELLKRGLHVTAMDISEEMLGQASRRLTGQGRRAQLISGDICDIRIHRPVDIITCVCDGVNYLTDIRDAERFFRGAFNNLKRGGALVFDVSSEYKLSNMDGELFYEDDEEITYFWQSSYNESDKLCQMELNFFIRQKDGLYSRFDESHLQRAYSEEELINMLKKVGFSLINTYGGYEDRPVSKESDRIVFTAFK